MDNPIIDGSGNKRWRLNNKLHRTDGPAVEFTDGDREWWVNGKMHRTDGPAVDWSSGEEWYLDNQKYTFDEWLEANKNLTYEQKVMMKLQYG
jgi:hypothetical protein